MKKAEWIKALEAEVEKVFDPAQVDGFENSAPGIKLGILADLYDNEKHTIEKSKEQAYAELADAYTVQALWN